MVKEGSSSVKAVEPNEINVNMNFNILIGYVIGNILKELEK